MERSQGPASTTRIAGLRANWGLTDMQQKLTGEVEAVS